MMTLTTVEATIMHYNYGAIEVILLD